MLSKAQRIVVVIALGLGLWIVGSYLASLGTGYPYGWTGYAPSSEGQFFVIPRWSLALHGVLHVIIWLLLIAIWALLSVRVLRPSPERTERR